MSWGEFFRSGAFLVPLVIWIPLLIIFGFTFWRELKRTHWDLLEMLVLFLVVGHVIAVPTAHALYMESIQGYSVAEVCVRGSEALLLALFMVGGAVWVFRRLNRFWERRRGPRLAYLVCGLLLFPAILVLIFGSIAFYITAFEKGHLRGAVIAAASILAAATVCGVLFRLHCKTQFLPDPGDKQS